MEINKFSIVLLLMATTVFAKKSDVGNCFSYIENLKINKNGNFHNKVKYRNHDFIRNTKSLLLQTENNIFLIDNGFINSRNYLTDFEETPTTEYQIFEQFINSQRFYKFYIQHLFTVEDRFISVDFQLRLKYFESINVPITKKAIAENTLCFLRYKEIFINSEKPMYN